MLHDVSRGALLYWWLQLTRGRRRARERAQARLARRRAARKQQLLRLVAVLHDLELRRCAAGSAGRKRRKVPRAAGGWRGSTLAGYIYKSDDVTCKKKFRMTKESFNDLCVLLSTRRVEDEKGRALLPKHGAKNAKKRKLIPLEFKVACCVYLLAHGCEVPVAADVASVGASTVRRWLNLFFTAVCALVKPVYMPSGPMDPERLEAVKSEFAARRGIPNVAMACDGSHVPFSTHDNDYRNYKGWYSTLVLAFVDSYHLFVEAEVGYAGRSGDNTILEQCYLMRQIAEDRERWLGKNGIILGDGGASDHDGVFMNPYRTPKQADECYFNFCHSSTRFVVEETFGRWKNRFRFLLRTHDMAHELHTRMVYTTIILHNYCTVKADNAVDFDVGSSTQWQKFFEKHKRHRCPSCVRAAIGHCLHGYRHRACARAPRMTGTPAVQRDLLKDELWEDMAQGLRGFEPANLSAREQREAKVHKVNTHALEKEMRRRAQV